MDSHHIDSPAACLLSTDGFCCLLATFSMCSVVECAFIIGANIKIPIDASNYKQLWLSCRTYIHIHVLIYN